MRYFFLLLFSAFSIATLANVSDAVEASPPEPLLGKSIVIEWSETRIQRNEGEQKFRNVQAIQNMSLYIGTTGRIFSRMTLTTGKGTGHSDQIQEGSAADPKFRQRATTFSGKSMTVVQPFQQGGMRRLIIDFGDNFGNCSAKASYVTEAGSPTSLARSPITKKMVEIQDIKMSLEACSVLSRNVFGNE